MIVLLEVTLFYLAVGVAVGILAGLLGIGGGMIIIPALLWMFHWQQIADSIAVQLAVGTSLAIIVLTASSSALAHHRRGAVSWSVFSRLTPGIIIGGLLGAVIADQLPGAVLQNIVGVFALAVGMQALFGANPAPGRTLPGRIGLGVAGSTIGLISSLVGVGGGALTVPFLSWCNVPIHRAIATSAACGLAIAITGTVGYIITGWHSGELPDYSLGYIYLPGFIGIATASALFAPLGARLAHALQPAVLKRIFAVFVISVGLSLLIG